MLRRGEAELRFLADSIPKLIWTATAEGFIDYHNRCTTDYTGLHKDDLGPTGWIGLLHSTLKFSHPNRPSSIVLRSYLTPDYHPIFKVRDNGLGMQLGNPQNTIFQLFMRQHAHIEGTGMGLYLVQRIVRSHGGHVEVASTPGEGSTFTLYWTKLV